MDWWSIIHLKSKERAKLRGIISIGWSMPSCQVNIATAVEAITRSLHSSSYPARPQLRAWWWKVFSFPSWSCSDHSGIPLLEWGRNRPRGKGTRSWSCARVEHLAKNKKELESKGWRRPRSGFERKRDQPTYKAEFRLLLGSVWHQPVQGGSRTP